MADFTLLGSLTGPGSNAGDFSPINLGLLFKVTSQCWCKALRFWRSDTGITGSPFGRLYSYIDEDNGSPVTGTDATFSLSGTGWQQADLGDPVELTVNQLYKVVVNFPSGWNGTGGYFATGDGVGGIASGPLTAPDAGGTPLGIGGVRQGTFASGSTLAYPTGFFQGGNYWVDLLVSDEEPGGGVARELDGVAPATSSSAGALSRLRPLSAAASASSLAVGSLARARPLAGVGSASSLATGSLAIARSLAAPVPATSSLSGALVAARSLAGSVPAASGAGGPVAVARRLAGSAPSASSAAGALSTSAPSTRGRISGARRRLATITGGER